MGRTSELQPPLIWLRSFLLTSRQNFCGHSSEVAQEHCWTTTEADLDAALSDGLGSIRLLAARDALRQLGAEWGEWARRDSKKHLKPWGNERVASGGLNGGLI